MKMKLVVLTMCSLGLLAGCGNHGSVTPKGPENTPILKQFIGRTDIVKVKHFFAPEELMAKDEREFVSAGHLELGSVIAYEPGKESDRRKGIRMEVVSTYVLDNEYSRPDSHVSFLDEDEAQDLAAALTYLKQVNGSWATAPPKDDVEVMFASKDDFSLSLLPQQGASSILYVESGNAAISFPAEMLDDLQQKLGACLQTLKSNEK